MGLVLTLVVAAVIWYIKNKDGKGLVPSAEGQQRTQQSSHPRSKSGSNRKANSGKKRYQTSGQKFPDSGLADSLARQLTQVNLKDRKYDVLKNCELIPHRNNDGDSFHVRHGGKETEFRLYFVDTAESHLHKYNGKRIREQGAYFGGLSMEQTTALGQMAKSFVKDLLGKQKFTVVTQWEDVYSPERKYCYVVVNYKGRQVYLHELLMAKGLVRLKTRGARMPEGKSFYDQKKKLQRMEAEAKRLKLGAWGM